METREESYADARRAYLTAEARMKQGDYHGALRILARYLQVWSQADAGQLPRSEQWSADNQVALEMLADVSLIVGDTDTARSLLSMLADHDMAFKRWFAYRYTMLKRVYVELVADRLMDARELLIESDILPCLISEIPDTDESFIEWEHALNYGTNDPKRQCVARAWLYLCLGRICTCHGMYQQAVALYRRGLEHADNPEASGLARATVPALSLGRIAALMEFGNLGEAERLLDEIDADAGSYMDPGAVHRRLELRGKLNMLRGNYDMGLGLYRALYHRCVEREVVPDILASGCTLGYALIETNNLILARQHLRYLLAYAANVMDVEAIRRINAMLDIVDLRASSSSAVDSITAAKVERGAVEGNQRGGLPDGNDHSMPDGAGFMLAFEEESNYLHADLGRFNLDSAIRRISIIERRFGHTDSRLIVAQIMMAHGTISLARSLDSPEQRFSLALEAAVQLEAAGEIFEELGAQPLLWECLRFRITCHLLCGESRLQVQPLVHRTQLLLDRLADSLTPDERALFLLNKWTVEEEMLAIEAHLLECRQAERAAASRWRRSILRWHEMRAIHHLLCHVEAQQIQRARQAISDSADENDQGISIRQFFGMLFRHDPRRATITWLVLPNRVLAITSSWGMLRLHSCPITVTDMRALVRTWHEKLNELIKKLEIIGKAGQSLPNPRVVLQREFSRFANRVNPVSDQLAEGLNLKSVLDSLPARIRSISFAPDDALHGFPFAAMRTGDGYLAERFAVSIALGSRRNHMDTYPPASVSSALLVGVGVELPGAPELSGVRPEIRLMRTITARAGLHTTTLLDNAATAESVHQCLQQVSFAHIACHGTFDPAMPANSGFVLPGTTNGEATFTLADLWRMQLPFLRHATLTACWLADNFIHPARIVLSLPQALRMAGVESVLASLWPINDDFAQQLMVRFYRNLRRQSRDAALRSIQLDCISGALCKHGGWDRSNPYFWAGMQIYGDPRPLDLFRRCRFRQAMRLLLHSLRSSSIWLPKLMRSTGRRIINASD